MFKTDGSLSQKTARGGIWVIASFTFGKILNFIQTIILVRLLLPSDFGLMSLASVAIGAMTVFTETGITPAVIQRKELSEGTLNTAWIINIIRGIALFILLFFISPAVAHFYKNDQLNLIIKILGAVFLLNGFNNIGIVLFSKELNFKKKVFFEQITNILSFIVTVALAFKWRNVWALVIGQVFFAAITLIVSYLIHPFRPLFKFNLKIAEELFRFGKHIFGSSIIIFIITNGDNALVGKVLGMTALGFYALAYNLSNLPATAITHVITQVSFPAYSKLQDDIPRLREAYKKVLGFTALLSIPLAAGLFILAPEFIRVAYGEKWLPMVPAMRVLCLFGIFRSIGATMGPVFQAVGRAEILTQLAFFSLVILLSVIYPLTVKFGILGTSIATLLAMVPIQVWAAFKVSKIMNSSPVTIFNVLVIPTASSLIMILAVYLLKHIMQINLFFLISWGLFIYFFLIVIVNKKIIKETVNIISSI